MTLLPEHFNLSMTISPSSIAVSLACAVMFAAFGVAQAIRVKQEYKDTQLILAQVLSLVTVCLLSLFCVLSLFIWDLWVMYFVCLLLNILLSSDKVVSKVRFLRKPILPKSHDERRF